MNKMSKIFSIAKFNESLKRFDKVLFLTLLARLIIPGIYATVRVYIIGNLDEKDAINIIAQLQWVNVILEIIEEGLLQPLYHCFGGSVGSEEKDVIRRKVRSGSLVCMLFYGVFCCLAGIFTPQLVRIMGQKDMFNEETIKYIRLELCGIFFRGQSKLFSIVLVLGKKSVFLNVILVFQLVISILSDLFFFSNLQFSLDLGTDGVAYSSIAQAFLTFLVSVTFALGSIGMMPWELLKIKLNEFSWMMTWTKQGLFSGLDSFIRNSVYLVVVIRAMNLLEQQDLYWIANGFIWNWLLLPVLALTDMLKQDVSTNHPKEKYGTIVPIYVSISITIVLLWAITAPGWYAFICNVLNAADKHPDVITNLVYQLMPGYLFFIVSSLNASIFYAKGKIQYLVLSSFIASCFMVGLFLFVIFSVFPSTLQVIAGIFESNMCFGSIVSCLLLKRFIKQGNIHYDNGDNVENDS